MHKWEWIGLYLPLIILIVLIVLIGLVHILPRFFSTVIP
jgi:hypothetical protein